MKTVKVKSLIVWTLGVLGVVVILLGSAAWYLSEHWKPILETKIKETVKSSTDSLYTIDFSNLHLNLITGNLSFDSLELTPDTAVYNQLKAKNEAPGSLYSIKVKLLIFNRISILQAYLNKKISLKAIVIDKPVVNVFKNATKKDSIRQVKTLYQRISKTLNSIHVKTIVLNDADLKYVNNTTKTPKTTVLKNVSVKVTDLLIDSASQFDKSRFYNAKDVFFQIKKYKKKTADNMYNMSFDDFSGSLSAKTVKLLGLKLTPLYSEMEFSNKYKVQHDRYAISVNEIALSGVDFEKWDAQERLIASKLEVADADVAIFLNRALPPPNIDKKINFPHIALQRLPIETRIDTVSIRNANIAYTEYNPLSSRKGTLTFKKLGGIITNVTNDKIALKQKNHANAQLSAYLMGTSKINIAIDFNLKDPDGSFSYKGTIGKLDLKTLNPLARNLALIEIKEGIVNKADFNIHANASRSSGNVNLYYTNLKINLLKKEEETLKLEKKGALSLLANVIVVKNNNPNKNEPLRKGPVVFERPRSASFFNEMWKSVFMGIREAVGLGIVGVKDPQKVKEDALDAAKKKKRRAERQKKREQKKEERKKDD